MAIKNMRGVGNCIIVALILALSIFFSVPTMAQAGAYVKAAKEVYSSGEPIIIEFGNLPGNKQDWITLVKKGLPENQWGEWFYTQSQVSGSHTFKGMSEGEYELRLYFNWPDGGFKVQDRFSFRVGGAVMPPQSKTTAYVKAAKEVYSSGEPIIIEFGNLPGNKQDWITLVKKGLPENQWGEWFYTQSQVSGSHTFKGISEGEYELRLYFNWPDGSFKVQDRFNFRVGNAK